MIDTTVQDACRGERIASYRRVRLSTFGRIREAGFALLATFDHPHFTVVLWFPVAMGEVLAALGIDPRFVAVETTEMQSVALAKTASRQVLSVMNDFAFMEAAGLDVVFEVDAAGRPGEPGGPADDGILAAAVTRV